MTEFVTEGVGSDQVLVPSSHGGIDHTIGPLSLLNAIAHDGIDHTAGPLLLMSAAAHNALDHGAIPATNVGENNPVQVSPAERTAGTEGVERSFSPFDVATMVAVHSTVSIVLSFGANLNAGTGLAAVNGNAATALVATDTPPARATSPKAGTGVTLAWSVSATGGVLAIRRNGAAVGSTINLSALTGTSIQVQATSLGDHWAIAHTSGTSPGGSTFQLMIS